MARTLLAFSILLIGLANSGCVFETLEPLYSVSAGEALTDPRLVGNWYVVGANLRIGAGPNQTYLYNATDAEGSEAAPYRLVQIGPRQYLFPVSDSTHRGTVLVGAAQVAVADDQLDLRFLNVFALYDRVTAGKTGLQFAQHGIRLEKLTTPSADPTSCEKPSTNPATDFKASAPTTQETPATGPTAGDVVELTGSREQIRAYLIAHQDDPELFYPVKATRWVAVAGPR